jgi:hypothetical protein
MVAVLRPEIGPGDADGGLTLSQAPSHLPRPRWAGLPPAPAWTEDEQARWRELWESPQATQWDDTCRGTVAILVAYEAAMFAGTASAWHPQEARYAAESLGLRPRAVAALGWRIVE